jgi:carbon-monoxide dehydrogenase small subunit
MSVGEEMSDGYSNLIRLNVNGTWHTIKVEGSERLLDVLRNKINLKGTKEGCGAGECGACSVIINGKAVLSCLILASSLDGSIITTIEGIGSAESLHPLQEAFIRVGAVQCGFCTPGMIMTAKTLLESNPAPTREEVREALGGNLCRCTGYMRIIEAVMTAAEIMRKRKT